jgi:hypothetical protein
VRPWIPRWRPYHPADAEPARLYVSGGCGPCSQVGRWIEGRRPIALRVVPAEAHPSRDLRRITYHSADGWEEEGVAALARALEHVHLGWALLGMAIRLPLIAQAIQLIVDASGGGPRTIPRRSLADDETQMPPRACAAAASINPLE